MRTSCPTCANANANAKADEGRPAGSDASENRGAAAFVPLRARLRWPKDLSGFVEQALGFFCGGAGGALVLDDG
jgi:hypothetical protein